MLKRMVIKNVNSIEKCEIDFTKGNYKFGEENVIGDFVNPIAVYGHNGSGKSAVLKAVQQFIFLLLSPVEMLRPFIVNDFLFREYFKGDKKDQEKIKGSVCFEFNVGNIRFVYFLETSSEGKISKEYLKKDDSFYFERNDNRYVFQGKNGNINDYSPLVPLLRLLASSEITDPTIQSVFAYLGSFTFVDLPYINRGSFVTSRLFNNMSTNDLLVNKSQEVKELLKQYDDFPIYTIAKDNRVLPNGLASPRYNLVFDDNGFRGTLPLEFMSVGMRNQSTLLSIIAAMPKDSALFIDEADLALHPSAIKSFLKVLHDKRIQVVMTLHNTYALQMLRPDQVYFAKWSKGFSNYCRLSKIYPNIREVNNIEKMYLSSVFDEALEEHA